MVASSDFVEGVRHASTGTTGSAAEALIDTGPPDGLSIDLASDPNEAAAIASAWFKPTSSAGTAGPKRARAWQQLRPSAPACARFDSEKI
jgi:hypothetical protein